MPSPRTSSPRTPTDRAYERRWRQGEQRMIENRKVAGNGDTTHHARNFLDCVKSRKPCHCDIETGHRSARRRRSSQTSPFSAAWSSNGMRIANSSGNDSKANRLLNLQLPRSLSSAEGLNHRRL